MVMVAQHDNEDMKGLLHPFTATSSFSRLLPDTVRKQVLLIIKMTNFSWIDYSISFPAPSVSQPEN